MNLNLIHTILLTAVFLALFTSAEILYRKFNWKAEASRKYVHASTGLLTMLFPPLLTNHWYVLGLCGSFLVILVLSKKLGYLPSIHGVPRVTQGSLLYPIIVYGCFMLYQYYDLFLFYYIPILILAISDPIAAAVGKKFPFGKYTAFGHTKTVSGSLGFFISAAMISGLLLGVLEAFGAMDVIILSLSVALITTLFEAISHHGYDNLTIPASAILTLGFILSILHP